MMADDTINKGILSFQFVFICFGFFQGNFSTILIYQLFPSRLEEFKTQANYLQPVLFTVGSIAGGLLLMFGRRKCALWADIPITAAGILTLFMDPMSLFIARVVNDLVRGALLIIYLIYLKEMVPKRYAGLSVCLMLFVSSLCLVFTTIIELILKLHNISLDTTGSKSMLISQIIVFAALIMCQTHFVTGLFVFRGESPRYLIEDQRKEEAYAIISLIYKNKDYAKDEMDFIQEASEFRQFRTVTWSTIWSSKNRRALFICCFLMLLRNAAGGQAFWSFLKVDTTEGMVILLAIYILNCLAPLLTGFCFESINLRVYIISGLLCCALANTLGLAFGYIDTTPGTETYYLSVAATGLSAVCSSLTIAPVAFLLSVQLLPDKGTALTVTCVWLSMFSVLVPFYFNAPEVPPHLYMEPTYIFFSVLGLVVCGCMIRDTKGTNEKVLKKAYIKKEF